MNCSKSDYFTKYMNVQNLRSPAQTSEGWSPGMHHFLQDFLKGCPVNSDLSRFKESERQIFFPIIIKCELFYEE